MRKPTFWICLGIVLLHGAVGAEERNDVSELRKRVMEQERRIEQLIGHVSVLESEITKKAGTVSDASRTSWTERIRFHGDLRYRHELIKAEENSARNRQRIRVRVALNATVTDTLSAGIQLASGSDDPVSTNMTFDGGFSSKSIWLDMAYFDWHPDDVSGLHVIGGKIKNPFHRKGGLIWDSDLRPEGGAVTYSRTRDAVTLFTNLGDFWVEERGTAADSGLFGAQAGIQYALKDTGRLMGGVSYFDYGNAKNRPSFFDVTDPFGNTVDLAGDYVFDYNLFESFVEFAFKMNHTPISLYGDYVTNTAAGVIHNQGWLAGIVIGKCKSPRSWAFQYNYRELEADAVLGAFTDSDFIGGGTDGSGHQVILNYQLAGSCQAGITYFHNKRDISTTEKNYQRLQVDFKLKFK